MYKQLLDTFSHFFGINKIKIVLCLFIFSILIFFSKAMARDYEVPPTISSGIHVPYISDEDMEECVKIYNEAKWLSNEINNTFVNQYDQDSVDSYNSKIDRYQKMIDFYNQNCAGKQSESAYKAAQKLNKSKQ